MQRGGKKHLCYYAVAFRRLFKSAFALDNSPAFLCASSWGGEIISEPSYAEFEMSIFIFFFFGQRGEEKEEEEENTGNNYVQNH